MRTIVSIVFINFALWVDRYLPISVISIAFERALLDQPPLPTTQILMLYMSLTENAPQVLVEEEMRKARDGEIWETKISSNGT